MGSEMCIRDRFDPCMSSMALRMRASTLIGQFYDYGKSIVNVEELKEFREELEIETGAKLCKSSKDGEVTYHFIAGLCL